MGREADVIVVGAGPAGSTAAKLLADRGYRVLLVDRSGFPRHKTCASWINRLAFERFDYLTPRLDELVENPFYGVAFYDRKVEREAKFVEDKPSGYLSLRAKFDDGLRHIAVEAGAEFLGGCAVVGVREERGAVVVRLADGREFRARAVVGADGASSRVAVAAGLRAGWKPGDYVVCANADIPFAPEGIEGLYGARFPFRVYLEFEGIQGYGWVFPKRRHICVGIGGRLEDNRQIRPLFSRFLNRLRELGHLPEEIREIGATFDIDPVGAVYNLPGLARGRVVLAGDAAGFVSGSTGEGIYPGMVSAELASELIHRGFARGNIEASLERIHQSWRDVLGDYVKRLPGGRQEARTRGRIEAIFRHAFVARVAARMFLYGERPGIGTFFKAAIG